MLQNIANRGGSLTEVERDTLRRDVIEALATPPNEAASQFTKTIDRVRMKAGDVIDVASIKSRAPRYPNLKAMTEQIEKDVDALSKRLPEIVTTRVGGRVNVPENVSRDLEICLPHAAYDKSSQMYANLQAFRDTADTAIASARRYAGTRRPPVSITVRFFK